MLSIWHLSRLGKTDNRLQPASPPVKDSAGARPRAVIFESTPSDSPIYLRSGLEAGDASRTAVIENWRDICSIPAKNAGERIRPSVLTECCSRIT